MRAQARNLPCLAELRAAYYEHLAATKQEDVAARLKEEEGDYEAALQLYLRAGKPVRAAALIHQQGLVHDPNLLETVRRRRRRQQASERSGVSLTGAPCAAQVARSMLEKKQFEQVGEFLEKLGQKERALDAYRRCVPCAPSARPSRNDASPCSGRAYKAAVALAKRDFKSFVTRLEEEWGDWLVSQKQYDAATNHYMEARIYVKAIDASLEAGQLRSTMKILENLDLEVARPYLQRVAK